MGVSLSFSSNLSLFVNLLQFVCELSSKLFIYLNNCGYLSFYLELAKRRWMIDIKLLPSLIYIPKHILTADKECPWQSH